LAGQLLYVAVIKRVEGGVNKDTRVDHILSGCWTRAALLLWMINWFGMAHGMDGWDGWMGWDGLSGFSYVKISTHY